MKPRVLVLNQDYQAISVCSVERAFLLVFCRKAEMVEAMPGRALRSAHDLFAYPSIIRLQRYVQLPFRRVSLNRANLFRRDGYQCQYCGSRYDLTIDHVIPRSANGRDTWDNLVTACQTCNTRKGNRTPEQANMPLYRRPARPSFILFLSDGAGTMQEAWRPYLMLN